jgi:Spy/CpxP family protein refolding chaperone
MQIFKTLLGLALTVTLAGTAFAAEGHRQHHDPLERLQAKLHLSEAQVSQLRPTFAEMHKDHKAEHEQFQASLRSILTPEQTAKLDAEAKSGEHHHHHHLNLSADQKAKMKGFWTQGRAQAKAEHEKLQAQMMAVLTPEQQAKLKEMQKSHHHGHRHHHHHDSEQKQG